MQSSAEGRSRLLESLKEVFCFFPTNGAKITLKAKFFWICTFLILFFLFRMRFSDILLTKKDVKLNLLINSSQKYENFVISEISNRSENPWDNFEILRKNWELLKNKENSSPKILIPNELQNKTPNSSKFQNQNLILNQISKNVGTESISEIMLKDGKMSFDDKCLTTRRDASATNFRSFKTKEQNFEFLKTEEGKMYKTISAYYHAFEKSFYFGFGYEPFEAACCKEKRCFMTNNRDKIPIEEFDAVIIHFRGLTKKILPKKRARHQRWVFYESEAPTHSGSNSQDFEGIFNWTMTYRRDSDIFSGYGELYNKKDFSVKDFGLYEDNSSSLSSVMNTKSKIVAWIVSHCHSKSKREQYVENLKNFLPVDIYGDCGPLKCPGRMSNKCYKMVEKDYKFYLSFENNYCRDYVTEKFFNILKYFVVPVVMGSADYASIAPPHSYINIKDFASPKELANYLIYLDRNDTAYMEYFSWKKDYFLMNMVPFYHAISFCTLCQKLHSDNTVKVYSNLKEWFVEKAECNKNENV